MEIKFLITGSSALEISETIFEPATGRYFLFHLYPFSQSELYVNKSPFEIEEYLNFHLIYGSYPEVCMKRNIAESIIKNLPQQYLYKDVLIWKNIRKPEILEKLLKLLAYQIGSEVSIFELAKNLNVKSETINTYIELLEKSFVIFRFKAFSTNPRKEVTKMNKIFFWDNGVRNAVIDNFNELSYKYDQGQLFENFIISERLKSNNLNNPNAKSFFWRNYNQNEVDYIECVNNRILAFEIKWNKRKKNYVSKAFTSQYPHAETNIINPDNYLDFLYRK